MAELTSFEILREAITRYWGNRISIEGPDEDNKTVTVFYRQESGALHKNDFKAPGLDTPWRDVAVEIRTWINDIIARGQPNWEDTTENLDF